MSEHDPEIVTGLLQAYRAGIFPMADPQTGAIDWYAPDPRALMPLSLVPDAHGRAFHVSRSLAAKLRARPFTLTTDVTFAGVLRSCGEPRVERPDSWIDERIIHAYTMLHSAGHAHSIEAWLPAGPLAQASAAFETRDQPFGRRRTDKTHQRAFSLGRPALVTPILSDDRERVLVGGIYGMAIGSAFFAESMFCRPELGHVTDASGLPKKLPGTDASKVCLFHLVSHLSERGYTVLDVQLRNAHTDQFGVYTVRRSEYLRMLAVACDRPTSWLPFEPSSHVVPTRVS